MGNLERVGCKVAGDGSGVEAERVDASIAAGKVERVVGNKKLGINLCLLGGDRLCLGYRWDGIGGTSFDIACGIVGCAEVSFCPIEIAIGKDRFTNEPVLGRLIENLRLKVWRSRVDGGSSCDSSRGYSRVSILSCSCGRGLDDNILAALQFAEGTVENIVLVRGRRGCLYPIDTIGTVQDYAAAGWLIEQAATALAGSDCCMSNWCARTR